MTEFEKIYRTYFNDVYRYILKLSGNEIVAEEITSETFFKAIQAIDSFNNECSIRVWLCQIAKNSYFTYLRQNKKHVDLDQFNEEDNIQWYNPVIEKMEDQSDSIMIQEILYELDEPYKEVFMLRVLEELSFKQIGSIFKKSDNWACVTYHRAKNMIIEKMEEKK